MNCEYGSCKRQARKSVIDGLMHYCGTCAKKVGQVLEHAPTATHIRYARILIPVYNEFCPSAPKWR